MFISASKPLSNPKQTLGHGYSIIKPCVKAAGTRMEREFNSPYFKSRTNTKRATHYKCNPEHRVPISTLPTMHTESCSRKMCVAGSTTVSRLQNPGEQREACFKTGKAANLSTEHLVFLANVEANLTNN